MTSPISSSDFDPTAYRQALGSFATGVCVVTAHTPEGARGMTVNSFTSVSLDPPLVLWCVDVNSDRHNAFAAADRFAIHILPVGDREVSHRFAKGNSTFGDHEFESGSDEPPRLIDALTRLDCQTDQTLVVGDHLVIVGRVTQFETRPGHGLTFFRGKYGQAVDPSVED